jgi:hypothetical protein
MAGLKFSKGISTAGVSILRSRDQVPLFGILFLGPYKPRPAQSIAHFKVGVAKISLKIQIEPVENHGPGLDHIQTLFYFPSYILLDIQCLTPSSVARRLARAPFPPTRFVFDTLLPLIILFFLSWMDAYAERL